MFLDNKTHGKVSDELKKALSLDTVLSIVSGKFSIYGYSVLQKELSKTKKVRLLLSKWQEHAINDLTGTAAESRLRRAFPADDRQTPRPHPSANHRPLRAFNE